MLDPSIRRLYDQASMSANRPLTMLLAATALFSFVVAVALQVTYPMPGYFTDITQWAASGHIDDTFTPLAYPLFAAPVYRLAGIPGILALQIALHVVLAAVCYGILRQLRLSSSWSAWGALPVVLYPDLILSIAKLWDVSLSTTLFLLIFLICLRISHAEEHTALGIAVLAGLLFAAAIFCRPNLILLLLLPAALFFTRKAASLPARGLSLAVLCIATAAGFVVLGVLSHGSPFFPRNGPYNLFAGHNPHTADALLKDLNAEPSLVTTYFETHPKTGPISQVYLPDLGPYYTQQSILFARRHPAEEVKLLFLKLFTLFRPDTKVHGLFTPSGLSKLIMALPAPLLLLALLIPGRPPLNCDDLLLLLGEILYVLPFLITNSDPRFRIPLDAILLLHLVSLVWRRFGASLPASSHA